MTVADSVEVIRYWLNEPEQRQDGSPNLIRTPDRIIVMLLVRSMHEYVRLEAQAFAGDTEAVVNEEDIDALLATDAEGNFDTSKRVPFHEAHISAIEERTLAKLNLRDQQGYRPEVLQALENIARLSRV